MSDFNGDGGQLRRRKGTSERRLSAGAPETATGSKDASTGNVVAGNDKCPLTTTLPIRTVSETNLREHWAKKAKRAKEQRTVTAWALGGARVKTSDARYLVTLTRIAPRPLDTDNLAASFKHVQDGVADALGVDDRHVAWTYAQRRGKPKEYAVEIRIEVT